MNSRICEKHMRSKKRLETEKQNEILTPELLI